MNNNDNSIASFISRKLFLLNKEHKGVTIENPIDKFSNAMNRARQNLDKVNITIDDKPLDASIVNSVKAEIPNVQGKSTIYTATANYHWGDGELAKQTKFGIEVIS